MKSRKKARDIQYINSYLISAENCYVCYVAYIVTNNVGPKMALKSEKFEKVSSSLHSWKLMSVV